MVLKDISVNSEFKAIGKAVFKNLSLYPNTAKGDIFLINDFADNIGKTIELQRNSDGKYFKGILEWVKVDIEPFTKVDLQNVLYMIKLKGYNNVFRIFAGKIESNSNYLKKYYFVMNNKIIWRIVFF